MGFTSRERQTKSEREQLRSGVEKAPQGDLRPELLNRIDEIIIFDPLTEADLEQVVDLLVNDVHKLLADRGIGLELTDAAKWVLVKEGFDPEYGARPLRRTVQRHVENPLSKLIWRASSGTATRCWWTSRRRASTRSSARPWGWRRARASGVRLKRVAPDANEPLVDRIRGQAEALEGVGPQE